MDNGEQPTVEQRREYCSEEGAHSYNFRGLVALNVELEYVPIPEVLYRSLSRNAWLIPTPSPIQRVIEIISECWRYVSSFGRMPMYKEPVNISDERVNEIIKALNGTLITEFGAWGTAAGYTGPPQFSEDLSIEDKRTIVALIQEAVYKYNVHEAIAGANSQIEELND
jgi:hypothetical protein